MKLGVRCWPDKFSFVVLDGSAVNPELIEHDVRRFPADLTRAGFLSWISSEVKGILSRRRISVAAYKQIEPNARKNSSLMRRAEVEGVIQAVLYESGCRDVSGLTKRQLKSALDFPDAASDVSDALLTSPLQELYGLDAEEAALAAWALLD
jgi:hypothetical protein